MGDVPPGLYEDLLTTALSNRLVYIEVENVQLCPLDPAVAHEALARHITRLTTHALRLVGGDSTAGVRRQVALANDTIRAITALSPDAATPEEAIAEPARTLLALAAPAGMPVPVTFPQRPEIP